jgi:hypothetical protein
VPSQPPAFLVVTETVVIADTRVVAVIAILGAILGVILASRIASGVRIAFGVRDGHRGEAYSNARREAKPGD